MRNTAWEDRDPGGWAGLFVVDDRQRVVEWSPGAAALTGLTADQALGRPCYDVVRGRELDSDAPLCRRGCSPFMAVHESRLSGCCVLLAAGPSGAAARLRCELMALPPQPGGALGRLSPCGAMAARGATPGGGASRDIVRDLSAFAALATSLAARPIEAGLDLALGGVREATGAESAEVFLADPGGREMLLAAYEGPFRSAFCEIDRFARGEGLPGLVLQRRVPVVATALAEERRYLRAGVKARGFRWALCVPLLGSDGVVGALGVASRRRLDVDGALRLLTWTGVALGAAVEAGRSRLREVLSAALLSGPGDLEGDLDRLLRATLSQALEVGEADGGTALLLDPDAGGPVRLVTAGPLGHAVCAGLQRGAAPICPVVASGLAKMLYGPRRSWPLPCRLLPHAGVARYCLPLLAGRTPLGVVQLAYERRVPSPPTRRLALLLGAADAAARLIARTQAAGRRPWIELPAAPVQGGDAIAALRDTRAVGGEPFLVVRCLGPFELRRAGVLVTPGEFLRRKALALLKVLLVHAGRPVARDAVLDLLWPDVDPEVGASRLHVVVHALRRVLEPTGSRPPWAFVRSEGDRYFFDPRESCWLDTEAFRASAARGQEAERAGELDAAFRAYEEAANLYRGHFLEDEPAQAWFEMERQYLREVALDVLKRLGGLHVRAGNLDRGIERYRTALRIDPVREELHQQLIEALWRAGRRDEALRQYRACRELLQRELGVAPLPETDRLVERVRGGLARQGPARAPSSA